MQTHDIPLPSLSYVSRSEPTTPGYPPTNVKLSSNQDGTIAAFQSNDTELTSLQPSAAAESDPLRTSLLLRPEETPSKKFGKQRNSGSISPRKGGTIIGGEPLSRIHSSDPSNSRKSAEVWNRRPDSPAGDQHRSSSRSPLGFLQHLSSSLHLGGNHRHVPSEPFVPVNPFESNWRYLPCCLSSPYDLEQGDELRETFGCDCEDVLPLGKLQSRLHSFRHLFATLCRETYLIFLLRFPAMYFSRVARIFQDAEISRPDIERMINAGNGDTRFFSGNMRNVPTIFVDPKIIEGATAETTDGDVGRMDAAAASVLYTPLPFPDEWTPESASPALFRFKHSWESFIDSLIREWKTLNVVSALLASAILTIFQLPDVANDPVTRTGVLLSLICALMSLSYGCMYIVRFGQMRSMLRASRWAEEASKTKTSIFWNVWVLLATPAIWLAWAMFCFIAVILSFVWRTGSVNDPSPRPPTSATAALVVRVLITATIGLGLVYMVLIVITLKTYGSRPSSRSNPEVQSDVEMQKIKQSKGKDDDEMDRRGRQRGWSRSRWQCA